MKNFNNFINENLRDKMVGKSYDEITKDMSLFNIFNNISKGNIPKEMMPSKEDTLKLSLNDRLYWVKNGPIPKNYKPSTEEIRKDKDYIKLDAIDKGYLVKNFDLDDSLLPSDEEINECIEEEYKERHGISIKETDKIIKELNDLGVDSKLDIRKNLVLDPGNKYYLNSPIRLYYHNILNGNHGILRVVSLKSAEKIVDSINKYSLLNSDITIKNPDGHFDSTTISVEYALKIKEQLEKL